MPKELVQDPTTHCDCGHPWDSHSTFYNGYRQWLFLCNTIIDNHFCKCRRVGMRRKG